MDEEQTQQSAHPASSAVDHRTLRIILGTISHGCARHEKRTELS